MLNTESILSYEDLKKSGRLAKSLSIVLMVFIKENKPLAAFEVIDLLFQKYGHPMVNCNSRICELANKGFLRKLPKEPGMFYRWEWTGRIEPMDVTEQVMRKERFCPHCQMPLSKRIKS